jgi:hypothetical protein
VPWPLGASFSAGVPLGTLQVFLGHKHGDITRHDSEPELQELIAAAEPVCYDDFGNTSAVTLLKKRVDRQSKDIAECFGRVLR